MHPDLEKVIHLQHVESQLRHIEADLGDLPRLKTEIEARLDEERARLDAAREGLAASQKARRQFESELQDLENKRSKYKSQLMEVKTNKEYTAMLHEIEGVEREIRSREDHILGEMEKAETFAAEVKHEEAAFKAVEQRHKDEVKALEARGATLKQETARLGGERDSAAAAVPQPLLDLFHRVAKLRGSAVAEAKDAMCQVCHVKLRLQMFVEIKKNEAVLQCPSCNRILYYEPVAPTVVSEP